MGSKRTVEAKDLKKFLKERGLTRSFKTFKRIKKKRGLQRELVFSNYDGTVSRKRILIIREKNRTVVRDFATLRPLATSRKKDLKEVWKSISTDGVDKRAFSVKTKAGKWEVKNTKKVFGIKLSNERKMVSYNKTLNRLRTITMTNSPGKKFGFAVVDAIYFSADGKKKRVQARSSGGFDLRREKSKALNDALRNGAAIAEFSPVDVEVVDYWFEVWKDEFISLKRVS